jgi:DNA-binding beta-propeller fold protein YncE
MPVIYSIYLSLSNLVPATFFGRGLAERFCFEYTTGGMDLLMTNHLRYHFLGILFFAAVAAAGCDSDHHSIGRLVNVWGWHGISDGRLQKPRAMAIDGQDQIYIVDYTARIQVFKTDGTFLRGWSTPIHTAGRPTGISIGNDGNVLVADTHYFRVLVYSPEGKLLRTVGGTHGEKPGEFGFVTDIAQDSQNNYYISEYGEFDRIQKFSPDWKFLKQWGSHGDKPGEFGRPQSMAIDKDDHLWVADACNHRIQEFDSEGKLLRIWGAEGSEAGQLHYPYGIVVAEDGAVYVSEFGNHRVQKFTPDGLSLGSWGEPGKKEGQLNNPWAIVRDRKGMVYVLDTNNHRVQVVKM